MFKKELPIIFIGLYVIIAVLVLGWSVFVKIGDMPVRVSVVSDNLAVNDNSNKIVSDDDMDDNISKKDMPKILFGRMGKGPSIWLMNEDGSDLKQIVSKNIGNSSSAVLSPEKDKLVYISVEKIRKLSQSTGRPKTFGIRVVDLITDESILIISRDIDQAKIGHPEFSSDGNYLAYFIEETENNILYITNLSNLTTNKVIEITSVYKASATGICWSPDGKKIAYIHDNNICVADLNGNIQKIVFGGEPERGGDLSGDKWDVFTIRDLSFSLDGKQIKYIKNSNKFKYTKDSNRFIVDIDGKNNKQFKWIDFEIDEDKYVRIVDLVPNSNRALILESWPKGHDPYMQRLLLYDIDSKETKVVYEGDEYYYPKISPNGKTIAVSTTDGMYFMGLNGENIRKISSISYHNILEWK